MHFEGFEGGQMPLQRRLPKFGFHSPNRTRLAIVNLDELERFEAGAVVDEDALRKLGLVKGRWDGLKVLGNGNLSKKLTVRAHKFSSRASEAIRGAGGSVEQLPLAVHKPESASKAHAGKGVKPTARPSA
jgi:large subunit ribosomal protein L15